MATVFEDAYGHRSVASAPALAAAAAGTTAAGTFIPVVAGLGAGSSTAITNAGSPPNDTRGTINCVAAGVPAAGVGATVFFSQPYNLIPGAVNVSACTAAGVSVAVSAANITVGKFDISFTAAPVAGTTYNVTYVVTA